MEVPNHCGKTPNILDRPDRRRRAFDIGFAPQRCLAPAHREAPWQRLLRRRSACAKHSRCRPALVWTSFRPVNEPVAPPPRQWRCGQHRRRKWVDGAVAGDRVIRRGRHFASSGLNVPMGLRAALTICESPSYGRNELARGYVAYIHRHARVWHTDLLWHGLTRFSPVALQKRQRKQPGVEQIRLCLQCRSR